MQANEYQKLRALNPYDAKLASGYAAAKYDFEHPQLKLGALWDDELTSAFGPLLDYDFTAMSKMCSNYWLSDRSKYVAMLEKMAQFSPARYYMVGEYYQNTNQQKALESYEKAVKLGRDDVQFANGCQWLVNYDYDHGKKGEALIMAKRAAEIYSHSGISTMAALCERMGHFAEAEKHYKEIGERYDSKEELAGFYVRNEDNDASYKDDGERMLASMSPGGLQKLNPSTLTHPPKNGIVIRSVSFRTDDLGMEVGDIVVGVNGIAVANPTQYHLARLTSKDPFTEFTFWQHSKQTYKTAKIQLYGQRLGCDITALGDVN